MSMRWREQGFVLTAVAVSAFIFSALAFSTLMVALSHRRLSSTSNEGRLRAYYAAEAGLVWAQQRLWKDPNYPLSSCITTPCPSSCAGSGAADTLSLDTNGDAVRETTVAITVTNCGAGNSHQVKAKVTY